MSEVIKKLQNVKTMPELDALRMETVKEMEKAGVEGYRIIQVAFIKAKNRLRRIPYNERAW